MRDEIVEVLVKCKTNIGLTALKIVLFAICALALVFSMLGIGIVGLILAIIFGGAGYLASVYSQVEYEYVYCNKELDVDVIYAQSKRKSVASYDLGKMEALVRVNSSKMNEFANRKCVEVDYSTKDKNNKDNVYALFYDGNVKVLFEPNERLLSAISYVAPRKIFKD